MSYFPFHFTGRPLSASSSTRVPWRVASRTLGSGRLASGLLTGGNDGD